MADLLAALGYEGKTNPLAGLPDEMLEVLEKHFAARKGDKAARPAAPAAAQPTRRRYNPATGAFE